MGTPREPRPDKGRTRRGSGNFLQRVLENSVARLIVSYARDLLDRLTEL